MKEFRKLKSLKYLYEINQDGVLRNTKSKKIRQPFIDKDGYYKINFNQSTLTVHAFIHQLVMEAWGTDKPDWATCIDHIDRNRKNNNINNLRWATAKINANNRDIEYLCKNGQPSNIPQDKLSRGWNKMTIIMDDTVEFESSFKAAEYIKSEQQLESKLITLSNGIRKAAHGSHKHYSHKHTWKFK